MSYFVQQFVNGTSLGTIDALIALGFVVIFKATGVINFAHGSLVLVGGYAIARLHDQVGFPAAVLAGVTVAGGLAILIERAFIRPLRGAEAGSLAILTIGVDILLSADLTRRLGTDLYTLGDPWGSDVVRFAGLSLPQSRLAAIIVGAVLLGTFYAAFRYTGWGVAMRASADDGETASLMGIPQGRVTLTAWALGGGLAAVGCVFLVSYPTPGLNSDIGALALGAAFPAAVIGGLDSTTGALLGGLAVGIGTALASGYEQALPFGQGFSGIVPFVLMMLVLLWRPAGLLGTRDVHRA